MSTDNYALKRTIHYIRYEYCEKCNGNDDDEPPKEFDKIIEHFETIDNMKEFVNKNKEFINPDMSLKVSYPNYQLKYEDYEDYEGYKYEDCKASKNIFASCEKEGFNGSVYGERDYKFETTRIEIIKDNAKSFIAGFE